MTQKIILVNASYPSEIQGTSHSEDIFAVGCGNAGKVTGEIMEALALKGFDGNFASLATRRNEIEPHAGEILEAVEGKRDHFILKDVVYTLREKDLDADLVTCRTMSPLKSGDILFVKYDVDRKETGVYSVVSRQESAACVPFYRDDRSGRITLDHYMPFIVKGSEGYLTDASGAEVAGPFKYAWPVGGGFFVTATSESQLDIMSSDGEVKIDGITKFAQNNRYLEFEKDGKYGFLEFCSGVVSPLFDLIEIDLGEPIRVKKDGCWGYLAEDFTFLPEDKVEEQEELSDEIYWFGGE